MKGNARRKLTPNQRNQLVQITLHMGREEGEIMSLEYGVGRYYAINRARDLGLAVKKVYRGGGEITDAVDHSDPRWAWAISRGEVRV